MIKRNLGARDWEFRCTFGGSGANTYNNVPTQVANQWFVPYGQAYAAGLNCFYAAWQIVAWSPTSAEHWQFQWQVPAGWDASPYMSVGPVAGNHVIGLWLKAKHWYVNVDASCNWTFGFEELQILYNIDGGAYTLIKTIGPVTESGANWDARFCRDEIDPTLLFTTGAPSIPPVCHTALVSEDLGAINAQADVESGFRYKDNGGAWVYSDDVWDDVKATGGTCGDCYLSPAGIGEFADSWTNRTSITGTYERSIEATGGGTAHCEADDFSGDYAYTWWRILEEFTARAVTAFALPRDMGVKDHRRQFDAYCNGVLVSHSDVTTTDAFTHCGYVKSAHHTRGHRTCMSFVPTGCPTPIDLPSDFCEFIETDQISWPTAPPCTLARALSYDVGPSMRHYRAFDQGGTLWLGRSGNYQPAVFDDFNVSQPITWAQVHQSRSELAGTLYVLYGDGTTVYLGKSTREGESLTLAITVATGLLGDFVWTANSHIYVYWNDAGTVKGAVYDTRLNLRRGPFTTNLTGLDPTGSISVDESVGRDGAWRVGILHAVGGNLYLKTAIDGINFS